MKPAVGLKMKNLRLVIGIVVILAIVCSPALAISKADLISYYKGSTAPTILTPTPAPTNQIQGRGSISVISDPAGASVYIDGGFKGFTPITITGISPTCGFESRPGRIRGQMCKIGGYFPHQIELTKIGYEKYIISDVIVTEGKTISFSVKLTPMEVESTLKPTIPTVVPTTSSISWWTWAAPTPTPLTPDIFPWIVPPTTAPTPTPSHTPCPPGTPYSICFA